MILLNFVIALISQSYDDVMERQLEAEYQQMTKLNRECRFMMKAIGRPCEVQNMFVLTTNSESGENKADEWHGFVVTVRSYLKTSTQKTKDKIHALNDKMDELEHDLSKDI